ncbi:FUT7 (predicted) [Pycnogonum litorale]
MFQGNKHMAISHTNIATQRQTIGLINSSENRRVVILLWTPIIYGVPAEEYSGMKPFRMCPHLNCEVVYHRNNESTADAILFPWYARQYFLRLPRRPNIQQVWIFMTIESPITCKKPINGQYNEYRDVFNWTMTYRKDSDVFEPYGNFTYKLTEKDQVHSDEIRKRLAGKTKLAAWFVTNKLATERLAYVKEMKKYINIDFYGPQEKLKCPKNQSGRCLAMIDNKYKFYLSFENSICLDYITEKAYIHVGRPTVPVVYGGADYKRLLPPNSYIDVGHFKTAKELAEYLLFLDKNDYLYMRYFDWMLKGRWVDDRRLWCTLCEKLTNRRHGEVKMYKDIYEWYYNDSTCIKVDGAHHPPRIKIEEQFGY